MSATRLLLVVALLVPPAAAQEHVFIPVDDDPDGDGPVTVEYTPDGSAILILHHQSDDVTFLDPLSRTVTDVVAVGEGPLDMAVGWPLPLVVTADYGGDTLTVVSLLSRQVLASVPLSGTRPYQVELSADRLSAVVGLAGDGPGTSTVSVVDLQTMTEVRSFPVVDQEPIPPIWTSWWWDGESYVGQELPEYARFALVPDDRTLVLPDRDGQRLRLYDYTTGKKAGKQWVGLQPTAVGVSPDGSFAVTVDGSAWWFDLARVDLATPLTLHGPFRVGGGCVTKDGLVVTSDRAIVGTLYDVVFVDTLLGTPEFVDGGALALERSHDGKFVLGPNVDGVHVVDIATRTPLAELPLLGRRIAVSPVSNEAAVLERRRAEDAHLLDANGVFSSLLGTVATGPPEEGDAPIKVAVAEQAGLVLTANSLSRNVTVVDLASGAPLWWISVDERPYNVAVDPAGTVAVVSTQSGLHVLDPRAGVRLARLPLRTCGLAVAEDGSEAYALSRSPPEVSIIELAGAASHVAASIPVPSWGWCSSSILFNRELVPSVAGILAVPLWSSNQLLLCDLPGRKVLARVDQAGGRATFAPDGQHAYVAAAEVKKVRIAGVDSKVVASAELPNPRRISVSDDGRTVYVVSWPGGGQPPELVVLEAQSMTVLATVPLPEDFMDIQLAGPFLLVATFDGQLHRYRAGAADTALIDVLDLGDFPRDLVYAETLSSIVTAQPGERDGVDIVRYGGTAASYCGPANLNSTGSSATISASGWMVAGLELALRASDLPPDEIGYFLIADAVGFVPFVGGTQGNLCLSGAIARLKDQTASSGAGGTIAAVVDTSALPFDPPLGVQPGETWYFQAWFRDQHPGPTSNMTDGVAVTFE